MRQWMLSLPYTLEAERFMYEHAGYGQKPNETAEQARRRCAREHAQDELLRRKRAATMALASMPELRALADYTRTLDAADLGALIAYATS